MVSTFHSLETGKRALSVGQASISTTGHNIANANTKGYSRQQVNQSTSPSLDVWTTGGTGQLGSGVSIDAITRVRDRFLDSQYRDQSSTLSESQTEKAAFDRLETIINEPSDSGLNSAMDQLANAWQDLANNPDSVSAQAVVKQRAQEFVEVAESMNNSLDNMKNDLEAQKTAALTEAESYLKQIDDLNKAIVRSGSQSNDLLDKRDAAVEALSNLVKINVTEKDGAYTIGFPSSELTYSEGKLTLPENGKVTGGKIGGLIQAESNRNAIQEKLNTTVNQFVTAINTGTQSAPNTVPAQVVTPLFTGVADSLTVNMDAVLGVPSAGMTTGIQDAKEPYLELVSTLGAQSQSAARSVANFEATLQATDNRRQSVSGVSLDEEMANLVKFQHAYSAAARLISTTDEMLDTIINRMAP